MSSVASLVIVALAAVGQPPATPLEEFGEMLVGRWIGDATLVADWPGIGKKGEKVVNHLTYRWIADRRGIEAEAFAGQGTGKGIYFWDPATKKIVEYRINSGGTTGRVEYVKKNGRWEFTLTGNQPDGAAYKAEGVILVKDGGATLIWEGPSGSMEGEKMLNLRDVYRRASK